MRKEKQTWTWFDLLYSTRGADNFGLRLIFSPASRTGSAPNLESATPIGTHLRSGFLLESNKSEGIEMYLFTPTISIIRSTRRQHSPNV